MTYAEKLKDPRWKALKRRLAKERHYTCEDCGRLSHLISELHLHHKYYDSDRLPFEYPDDVFKLLCGECHEVVTEALKSMLFCLGRFTGDQIVALEIALTNAVVDAGENGPTVIYNWLLACLEDPKRAQLTFRDGTST